MKKNVIRVAVAALPVCAAMVTAHADTTIANNITLTADADWRTDGVVTVPQGVTVDLNGHTLWVSGLAGAGRRRLRLPDPTTAARGRRSTADHRKQDGASRRSARILSRTNGRTGTTASPSRRATMAATSSSSSDFSTDGRRKTHWCWIWRGLTQATSRTFPHPNRDAFLLAMQCCPAICS